MRKRSPGQAGDRPAADDRLVRDHRARSAKGGWPTSTSWWLIITSSAGSSPSRSTSGPADEPPEAGDRPGWKDTTSSRCTRRSPTPSPAPRGRASSTSPAAHRDRHPPRPRGAGNSATNATPRASGRALLDALDAPAREGRGRTRRACATARRSPATTSPRPCAASGRGWPRPSPSPTARGVLHCDIKPANILVTRYGRPMLADFNVSFDLAAARRPRCGGTLAYMPQALPRDDRGARRRGRRAVDIFSLGVVLHELATGSLPSRDRDPAGPDLRSNWPSRSAVA